MPTSDPLTFFASSGFSGDTLYIGEAIPVPRNDMLQLDVSGYDYWTTLSGVSKTSPSTSDELIAASYGRLCELYWSFNGTTLENDDPVAPETTLDIDSEYGDTPISRAGAYSYTYQAFSTGSGYDQLFDINLDLLANAIRMYNGSTDDEENFVGYGIGGDEAWLADFFLRFRFSDNDIEGALASVDESGQYNEAGYIVMDEKYHFVAMAAGTDPGTLKSTTAFVVEGITYTVSFNSFDFYTYG